MTPEILLERFRYVREEGEFYYIKNFAAAKIGDVAGSICKDGYRNIKINGKMYRAHRLIWCIENGEMPPADVDHINRVRDDNRITNLRLCIDGVVNEHNTEASSRNGGLRAITIDGKIVVHPYWFYSLSEANEMKKYFNTHIEPLEIKINYGELYDA